MSYRVTHCPGALGQDRLGGREVGKEINSKKNPKCCINQTDIGDIALQIKLGFTLVFV